MSQVIQAKCPHCQQMLRIPAAWLNMPMKCKHCKQIFQTKSRVADDDPAKTPSPPTGEPLIKYARSTSSSYRRKRSLWKGATVFVLLLAVVGGAGYFVYPYVGALFNAVEKEQTGPRVVAVAKSRQDNPASEKKPELAPDKNDHSLEPVAEKDDPKKDVKSDDPPKKTPPPVKNDPPKKKDQDQPKKKKAGPDDNGPYPHRAL